MMFSQAALFPEDASAAGSAALGAVALADWTAGENRGSFDEAFARLCGRLRGVFEATLACRRGDAAVFPASHERGAKAGRGGRATAFLLAALSAEGGESAAAAAAAGGPAAPSASAEGAGAGGRQGARAEFSKAEEAINTPFCPLQEISHTFVLRGLRNISEDP